MEATKLIFSFKNLCKILPQESWFCLWYAEIQQKFSKV